ncbi:MAG: N-6 DNA methylase, partial [Bacteroidales bacterium]|nr:N-6 DNA methylase [Bacteroidales bacterium]
TGVAREHTYRGSFQVLLTSLLPKGYTVVNEPARIACGAPDYIILHGEVPMAFVEAKDLNDRDLDGNGEHKEQFERYKNSLDNIVFTDYLDFHLYIGGVFQDAVRLAEIRGNKIEAIESNVESFIQMIQRLANSKPQRITSPVRLAKVMANKAQMLAQVIEQALDNDTDGITELSQQMKVFKDLLIHDLNNKTFADIYAQTIAYGLFTARLYDKTPEDFSRMEANSLIPKSNPFLRKIFNDIAGFNIDNRIEWIVDDLVEAFRVTDMSKVMKDFGESTKRNDPMMHFYEDFLNQYDPQTRAKRGVYYTPQPVVDFIVRAVDDILKRDFNLPMGLADNSMIEHEVVNDQYTGKKGDSKTLKKRMHRVQILDPATGTGTFLATVIRQIHANMEGQWGAWNSYVEQHLIPRLNGFELMMASYTIAHLKLSMVLHQTGFTQQSDKRLHVYLTNSLEEHNADTGTLFSAAISNESNEASYIKRDTPVMVMIGNPPYSVSSSNNSDYIVRLLNDYKKDLNERNIQPLSDDYIKFIRLGQEYISRTGEGILAFICNNSFIDGIIHRQMRKELMQKFDEIYILDLHGNSRKKETAPDGSKDENVFDIMPGVSINIFVKKPQKTKSCKVFHSDLLGCQEYKYNYLDNNNLQNIKWIEVKPIEPYFFYIPKDFSLREDYEKGFKVDELMSVNAFGIVTFRDYLLVNESYQICQNTLNDLQSLNEHDFRQKYNIEDSRDWSYFNAKENAKYASIERISYRPFDEQFVLYSKKSKGVISYPRYEIMRHLIRKNNQALTLIRVNRGDEFCVFVSSNITDKTILSPKDNANVFPLYLYSEDEGIRVPNLNKEIWNKFNAAIGEETTPEVLFDYIYAVLHSPSYRTKYKEFLKIDFPRIPYPTTAEEYHRLSAIGSQLRKLHLMEEVPTTKHAQFNTAGSNIVDKPEYNGGNVWINKEQCFEDVPETAWNFYIGGYQPAQKWLKDRRGRELTFDDIAHYRKIITVLEETDRLMKEIDKE